MKESAFARAICKKLPAEVYCEGTGASSFGKNGTPDKYIDYRRDLWVEFKMARTFGNKGYNVGADDNSMLSGLQKRWLKRRYSAGKNACVIVGVPSNHARGFVLETPDEWASLVLPELFIPRLKYAGELAAYILSRVS